MVSNSIVFGMKQNFLSSHCVMPVLYSTSYREESANSNISISTMGGYLKRKDIRSLTPVESNINVLPSLRNYSDNSEKNKRTDADVDLYLHHDL
jgi:hypothetical protein